MFPLLQPELTASFDAANAVAADTDGIFFLGGCTDGSMSGFVNAGGFDWVVAKVSGVDGSVLWYWQVGPSFFLLKRAPLVTLGGRLCAG